MAKKGSKKKGSKKGGGMKGGMGKGMGKGSCMLVAVALAGLLGGCSLLGMSSGGATGGTSSICMPDPTGNFRCGSCLSNAEAKAFNVGKLLADWAPAIPAILASLGHPNPSVAEVTNAIATMAGQVRTEPCAATPV